jgi:hypothetical protein
VTSERELRLTRERLDQVDDRLRRLAQLAMALQVEVRRLAELLDGERPEPTSGTMAELLRRER